MLAAQKQQSCELQCKARILKGKKVQNSSNKLEARVTVLKANTTIAIKSCLHTKSSKAMIGTIKL